MQSLVRNEVTQNIPDIQLSGLLDLAERTYGEYPYRSALFISLTNENFSIYVLHDSVLQIVIESFIFVRLQHFRRTHDNKLMPCISSMISRMDMIIWIGHKTATFIKSFSSNGKFIYRRVYFKN